MSEHASHPQPPPHGTPPPAVPPLPPPPGYDAAFGPPPGSDTPGAMPPPYAQVYQLQPGMPGPLYLSPPNSTLATISLIFGILGVTFLPFFGALVAVICGHLALVEVDRSQGAIGGHGQALAGVILGYIGLALTVLGFLLFISFASFFLSHATFTAPTPVPGS